MDLNASVIPENPCFSKMVDIVDTNPPSQLYISPVGCGGILRRSIERNLNMNARLEKIMTDISNEMSVEEIEKRSRRQKRGAFSIQKEVDDLKKTQQIDLFSTIV